MKGHLILMFSFALLFGCSSEPQDWPLTRFEENQWKNAKEEHRFIFVKDLISTKKMTGLSKEQLLSLLGEPSFDDPEGKYVTYIVKIRSGELFILDVRFASQDGKAVVTDYFVRKD